MTLDREHMFKLDYRIVHSEYDDYIGQNGFLQIKCNGCMYGEMYFNREQLVNSFAVHIAHGAQALYALLAISLQEP